MMLRATLGEKDHERLISEHKLTRAYLSGGRIKEAIKMFEHVLTVWRETLDEKDYSRLVLEHILATAYHNNREIEKAIESIEQLLQYEPFVPLRLGLEPPKNAVGGCTASSRSCTISSLDRDLLYLSSAGSGDY